MSKIIHFLIFFIFWLSKRKTKYVIRGTEKIENSLKHIHYLKRKECKLQQIILGKKKNAPSVQRTTVLVRYHPRFFRAASKEPLKLHLLKTAPRCF